MPIKVPVETPIDYLVKRKFPGNIKFPEDVFFGHTDSSHLSKVQDNQLLRQRQERAEQAASYRHDLLKLSKGELEALYQQEKQLALQELQEKQDREEAAKFYNQPFADANFTHWGRAAYWSLEEAIALSFGKNPRIVSLAKIKPNIEGAYAPFYERYRDLHDLAQRAKLMRQLTDPVLPGYFIAWVKRNGVAVPAELESEVRKNGGSIADWRTVYDTLHAAFEAYKQNAATELATAQAQIEELQADLRERQEKPLGTRERETLLKMIITMAMRGYGYNPEAKKNEAVSEIHQDLTSLGMSLEQDTIRKWLKLSAEECLSNDALKDA